MTRNRGVVTLHKRYEVPLRALADLAKPIYVGCCVQVRSNRHFGGIEYKGKYGKVVGVDPGVRHVELFSVQFACGAICVFTGIEIHPVRLLGGEVASL